MHGSHPAGLHGKLGMRAGSTGWINFQDVRIPAENLVGEEGEGFKIAMSCLDNGRYTVAAGATGLIRASLEASVSYAKSRKTFGKPIAEHQLIQEKIAKMSQDYEIATPGEGDGTTHYHPPGGTVVSRGTSLGAPIGSPLKKTSERTY